MSDNFENTFSEIYYNSPDSLYDLENYDGYNKYDLYEKSKEIMDNILEILPEETLEVKSTDPYSEHRRFLILRSPLVETDEHGDLTYSHLVITPNGMRVLEFYKKFPIEEGLPPYNLSMATDFKKSNPTDKCEAGFTYYPAESISFGTKSHTYILEDDIPIEELDRYVFFSDYTYRKTNSTEVEQLVQNSREKELERHKILESIKKEREMITYTSKKLEALPEYTEVINSEYNSSRYITNLNDLTYIQTRLETPEESLGFAKLELTTQAMNLMANIKETFKDDAISVGLLNDELTNFIILKTPEITVKEKKIIFKHLVITPDGIRVLQITDSNPSKYNCQGYFLRYHFGEGDIHDFGSGIDSRFTGFYNEPKGFRDSSTWEIISFGNERTTFPLNEDLTDTEKQTSKNNDYMYRKPSSKSEIEALILNSSKEMIEKREERKRKDMEIERVKKISKIIEDEMSVMKDTDNILKKQSKSQNNIE